VCLASLGDIAYFQRVEDGLSPAFLELESKLKSDNEGPARPASLHFQRDAYWPMPHSNTSLFDSEADATAKGARLPWSRRLDSTLLLPLPNGNSLHLWV
jgi:hypothetical protein